MFDQSVLLQHMHQHLCSAFSCFLYLTCVFYDSQDAAGYGNTDGNWAGNAFKLANNQYGNAFVDVSLATVHIAVLRVVSIPTV